MRTKVCNVYHNSYTRYTTQGTWFSSDEVADVVADRIINPPIPTGYKERLRLAYRVRARLK